MARSGDFLACARHPEYHRSGVTAVAYLQRNACS